MPTKCNGGNASGGNARCSRPWWGVSARPCMSHGASRGIVLRDTQLAASEWLAVPRKRLPGVSGSNRDCVNTPAPALAGLFTSRCDVEEKHQHNRRCRPEPRLPNGRSLQYAPSRCPSRQAHPNRPPYTCLCASGRRGCAARCRCSPAAPHVRGGRCACYNRRRGHRRSSLLPQRVHEFVGEHPTHLRAALPSHSTQSPPTAHAGCPLVKLPRGCAGGKIMVRHAENHASQTQQNCLHQGFGLWSTMSFSHNRMAMKVQEGGNTCPLRPWTQP